MAKTRSKKKKLARVAADDLYTRIRDLPDDMKVLILLLAERGMTGRFIASQVNAHGHGIPEPGALYRFCCKHGRRLGDYRNARNDAGKRAVDEAYRKANSRNTGVDLAA